MKIINHQKGRKAFDKGSKRRLRQIRWKLAEIVTLVLLAIVAFAVSFVIAISEIHHVRLHSEPSKVPQVKSAESAED